MMGEADAKNILYAFGAIGFGAFCIWVGSPDSSSPTWDMGWAGGGALILVLGVLTIVYYIHSFVAGRSFAAESTRKSMETAPAPHDPYSSPPAGPITAPQNPCPNCGREMAWDGTRGRLACVRCG